MTVRAGSWTTARHSRAADRRLAQALVADAEVMTLRAAARRHGVGWHRINAFVRASAEIAAARRQSARRQLTGVSAYANMLTTVSTQDAVGPIQGHNLSEGG